MTSKAKINNCIAIVKVYYGNIIDEYERQKEIFILVKIKLIWLIKAKDVKSNFKALEKCDKLVE